MISSRVDSLNKSATLKITAQTKALIKEGRDVINFAAGEPDFNVPDFVKDEIVKALREGATKYTPSTGLLELKKAIAEKFKKDNGIPCSSEDIIVTPGAKFGIFIGIFTKIQEDDEVILPAPYWVSYPEMIKLAGGKIKSVVTDKTNNFKITAKKLRENIGKKTKMLILNYPSNPTGMTYSRGELEDILEVVKETGIFVLSDEIYEKIIFDGRKHTSFASLKDAADLTITVNGFSKNFSMTGLRIGYLTAPANIIQAAAKIVDHTTSCACSLSQRGAIAALRENEAWEMKIKEEFQKRRDTLYEGLSSIEGVSPLKPEGTFYMFCGIEKTGMSAEQFAMRLLEEQMVSVIPSESFGQDGFVRVSFATSLENIKRGVERIGDFTAKL